MVLQLGADELIKHGDKRKSNDGHDYHRKIVFDERNIAKEISGKNKTAYPDDAAEDIVGNEFDVIHPADAGYKWGKCPDNGNKPGQEDSLATMFFEKCVGLVDVLLMNGNPGIGNKPVTEKVTDPVVGGIA